MVSVSNHSFITRTTKWSQQLREEYRKRLCLSKLSSVYSLGGWAASAQERGADWRCKFRSMKFIVEIWRCFHMCEHGGQRPKLSTFFTYSPCSFLMWRSLREPRSHSFSSTGCPLRSRILRPHSPIVEITDPFSCSSCSLWVSGIKFRPSCLFRKHISNRSLSPVPWLFLAEQRTVAISKDWH